MKIQLVTNGPILRYGVKYKMEEKTETAYVEQVFRHTCHSFIKASQRGILGDKMITTLEYGETFFKQGYIFYVLGEHNIPDHLKKNSKKLQNTVVILAADSNRVITCYRSKNAFKNIKLKPKYLCKDYGPFNDVDLISYQPKAA